MILLVCILIQKLDTLSRYKQHIGLDSPVLSLSLSLCLSLSLTLIGFRANFLKMCGRVPVKVLF